MNFYAPVPYQEVADLTVNTLAVILKVQHPHTLEYYTYIKNDIADIELTELGLRKRLIR